MAETTAAGSPGPVLIDCDSCPVRATGCAQCAVAVLLDPSAQLVPAEARAVQVLQAGGVLGPLHLALVRAPEQRRTEGRPRAAREAGRLAVREGAVGRGIRRQAG